MSKSAITTQPLAMHVREALAEHGDKSLEERAAIAWSAEAQRRADLAAREIQKRLKRTLDVDVEAVTELFARVQPRECAGAVVDGRLFGFRTYEQREYLALVSASCSAKDCDNELWFPINGLVALGKAFVLAESEGASPDWKCRGHSKR